MRSSFVNSLPPSLSDQLYVMTASRERTTRAAGAGRPLPLSAALLLARSFALVALAAVALLVALAAWFAVRAALAVDPVVATERVWLQYG
jgi:hypothetical protein